MSVRRTVAQSSAGLLLLAAFAAGPSVAFGDAPASPGGPGPSDGGCATDAVPQAFVSPTSPKVGETVTITGQCFPERGAIVLNVSDAKGGYYSVEATVGGSGSVTATFTPEVDGEHTFIFNYEGGQQPADGAFNVQGDGSDDTGDDEDGDESGDSDDSDSGSDTGEGGADEGDDSAESGEGGDDSGSAIATRIRATTARTRITAEVPRPAAPATVTTPAPTTPAMAATPTPETTRHRRPRTATSPATLRTPTRGSRAATTPRPTPPPSPSPVMRRTATPLRRPRTTTPRARAAPPHSRRPRPARRPTTSRPPSRRRPLTRSSRPRSRC